jgi:hypothetical protein
MSDFFKQFGGEAEAEPQPKSGTANPQDFFSQFGGQQENAPSEPSPSKSEGFFQQFGGQAEADPGPPGSGPLKKAELEAIAAKHGVPVSDLELYVPFFGGSVEGQPDSFRNLFWRGAGFVGESLAMGLPQKYSIKKQESENERQALDDLRQLVEDRKSGLQKGAEIVGSLAGGIGLARGIARGASAAPKVAAALDTASPIVGGAVSGYGVSTEDTELSSAATGAALGAAALGLFKGAGKLLRKGAKPEATASAAKAVASTVAKTEELAAGLDIERKVQQALEPELPRLRESFTESLKVDDAEKLAPEQLSDLQGFARYLGREKADPESSLAMLRQRVSTEGVPAVVKEFENFKKVETAFTIMGKEVDEVYQSVGARPFSEAVKDFFKDGLFAMRTIDDRLGTSLETEVAQKLSEANNRFTVSLASTARDIKLLRKSMNGSKLGSEELYRILDGTGDDLSLNADQQRTVAEAKRIWEDLRLFANDIGIPVKALAGGKGSYVLHTLAKPAELVSRITLRAEQAGKQIGVDLVGQGVDDAGFEALKKADGDLVQAVALLSDGSLNSALEFNKGLRRALAGRDIMENYTTKAVSAQARKDGIPEFIREKDVLGLIARWSQNTFKHAFYREGLSDLRKARDTAIAVNDGRAAKYLTNLMADIVGVRGNTLHGAIKKKMEQFTIEHTKAADRAVAPLSKKWHQFLADSPEFLPNLLQQVYPNFLGLKPQAIVMNLTQPFMMTMPELGLRYGPAKVMKAYGAVADIARKGRTIQLSPELARQLGKEPGQEFFTRNAALVLRNQGQLPAQWSTELRDALRTGIEKSGPSRLAGAALDKVTDVAMKGFELSEVMNRAVASEIAVGITDDLMGKGTARAQKLANEFLANAGSAFRREVGDALKAGDREAVEKLTRQYLTSKTIFNYNRVTMSEYGRFVGPMFSVFTKWPTSIAGDVLEQYRRKGGLKGSAEIGRKYLAPLAAVAMIDRFVMPGEEESPMRRLLLGKGGLSAGAPIGTIMAMATGDIAQPPAVATATETIKGFGKDPAGALWRGFNNAVSAFTPGAVLLRTYTDLRDFANEEDTKGTFINQIIPDAEPDQKVRDFQQGISDRLDNFRLSK